MNTSGTDLSIVAIIALYNGAKFIEESINSVLSQTLKPTEFLVIDDGSTDDGPAIVERLAEKHPVKLLRKENGGQSSARNFGVANSKSALIALLDQDDAWYPHHLEKLVEPFKEKRGIPLGWVYSNLDEIDEGGGIVTKNFLSTIPTEHPKRTLRNCIAQDMFVLPSASLIARSAFEAVGGFDERLSGYEDDDLFLRLFRAGFDNVYLNEPLSKWRIYLGSTSYSPRMSRSRMIYARKLFELYPDDTARARHYVRDLTLPRFLANLNGHYRDAFKAWDYKGLAGYLADMWTLVPYRPDTMVKHLNGLLTELRAEAKKRNDPIALKIAVENLLALVPYLAALTGAEIPEGYAPKAISQTAPTVAASAPPEAQGFYDPWHTMGEAETFAAAPASILLSLGGPQILMEPSKITPPDRSELSSPPLRLIT